MIEYELKYGFMYTRYHGSLRSKDHMHYSHYENFLLQTVKVPLEILKLDPFSELIL